MVTASGPTGLVDLLYGLERKPYGENRNSDSRVNCAPRCLAILPGESVDGFREKGPQIHAFETTDYRVSSILARFRDVDFRQYRLHINNASTEHQYGSQHGNTRAETLRLVITQQLRTLSFGKEIEEHTIQQGSPCEALPTARVIARGQSLRRIPWNVEGNPESLATVTGNWAPNSLPKGPQTRGIRGNNDRGGNRGHHMKTPPESRE
ncbi:hypothetical protein R3P38DRAFT_2815761 [Favolaschia claudopus]|uniref:Uncharacterized protein n=1 Tax=Favolaschia claudopus TaxID=2862362 RepID=A0AAV9Z0Y7_9AGAR